MGISDRDLEAARRSGNADRQTQPHAKAVLYVSERQAVVLTLLTDVLLEVPLSLIPELQAATEDELTDHLKLSPSGSAITCRPLDADIAVDGLLLDVLGASGWKSALRAALAREIAGSRSPRKAAAARENGKKGGRPRKQE